MSFRLRYSVLFAVFLSALTAASLLAVPTPTQAQRKWVEDATTKRVALVIGCAEYRHGRQLTNPVRDAVAMAKALNDLDFDVILCKDPSLEEMENALDRFTSKISTNSVALFYYSGHGVQVNGENYLLPVDFKAASAGEVKYRAMAAQIPLTRMDAKGSPLNLMILDACRDNPFKGWNKSQQSGLTKMEAPNGTLIAYATASGNVADDNSGGVNGLYTEELLRAIRTPGLKVEDVFKQVRRQVRLRSQSKQLPDYSSSMEGDFFFVAEKLLEPKVIPVKNPVAVVKTKPKPTPPPAAPNTLSLQAPRTIAAYKAQMVTIPAGTFNMGAIDISDDEKPVHRVTLSSFKMGRTLVTVSMWKEYCKATGEEMPSAPDWGWIDDHPIVNVSRDDIAGKDGKGGFCKWAGLSLPTEAQWEYAAKGGQDVKWPWGNTFDASKLWCSKAGFGDAGKTAPVIRRDRVFVNRFGLMDMAGNVEQWCLDWYAHYSSNTETDPIGAISGDSGVPRGGSWNFSGANYFRTALRSRSNPTNRYVLRGFRCVVSGFR